MNELTRKTDPVTILHLSDLHFGWDGDERRRVERKSALDGLLRSLDKLEPEWRPEVVCVTGDVGWRGQPSDYAEAGVWIRRLLDRLGLTPEALFMCPGNHDSDRRLAKLNTRPTGSKQADERLVTPIPDSFVRPFQAYADFYRDLNAPPYAMGDEESFLVGRRTYRGINFVAHNSAWYSQSRADQGRLWIGLNLLRTLQSRGQLPHPSELDEYPFTVALIHHPLEWFHQEELHVHTLRPSTFDYLARRCHLLLTGHVHGAPRPADQFAEAAWHLSGGAGYAGTRHFNSFRLIRAGADSFVYQTYEYDPRSPDDLWREVGDGPEEKSFRRLGEGRAGREVSDVEASETLDVAEVLEYLDNLASRMAELPAYYPSHLRADEAGKTRFDDVRQMVQVVEDRSAFESWRAEEGERIRATGQGFDPTVYSPARSLPEAEEYDDGRARRPAPPKPIPWDERAGERFRRAVILGDPGFGKTWLLHYEARRLAADAARRLREQAVGLEEITLPLFARLPDINQSDDHLEDALAARAGAELASGGSDAFRRFVREKMNSDRCVVLLDALDEVPVETPADGQPIGFRPGYRQRLSRRLADFARQFPRPRLLLTSRIVGYDPSQLSVPNLQELELLAFDVPQTEAFVSAWFGGDAQAANQFLTTLRRIPQVRGLGRIPLMLTLLCRASLECRERRCELPTHRAEFYDLCLRGLLRDWKGEKEQPQIGDAYVDAVLELLHEVGFTLFVEGREQFGESDLRRQIKPWLDGLTSSHELSGRNAASLIAELKRDGVLINAGGHGGAPLLFLHRTFHEYLTARTLAEIVNGRGWRGEVGVRGKVLTVEQLLERKAWDPRWQEVIALLAGRLRDPAPLLSLLADRKTDDLLRHRLVLAVSCLPEIKPAQRTWRLSRLIDRITADAFRLWWNHQTRNTKDGQPIPALLDHALPALAQANGRVNGRPLLELICSYLRSEENQEQAVAVDFIGKVGSVAVNTDPKLLDRLARILQTEEKWAAVHAITALRSAAATRPIITPLVRMLQDQDKDEFVAVIVGNALAQFVFDPEAGTRAVVLERLAQVIQDPDSPVWHSISYSVLRMLGLNRGFREYFDDTKYPTKAEALAGLLDDLTELTQRSPGEEEEAVEEAEGETEPMILLNDFFPIPLGELARKLESENWPERSQALRAVFKYGGAVASKDILDRLVRILEAADSGVAVTPASLDQLERMLDDPYWGTGAFIHSISVYALSNRMPLFKSWSVAAMAVGATDYVRRHVPEAPPDRLNRLSEELFGDAVFDEEFFGDLNRLARMLQESGLEVPVDKLWGVTISQLRVLASLTPRLFERSVAVMAVRALGETAEDEDVLDRLSRMLADERYEVWTAAAMAIAGIGGGAAKRSVLSQVARMLEEDDWLKRHAAVIMLLGLGRESADTPDFIERILGRLEQMLAHQNWLERFAGLTAAASIGSAATRPEIISPLVRMLRDELPQLRSVAAVALGRVQRPGVYFFVTKDGVRIRSAAELAAV